jgi:putative endonuclease
MQAVRSFSGYVGGLFLFNECFMEHFVYIIYSESKNLYYKGYSLNPQNRLQEHNNGESIFTRNKGPWILVYLEQFDTKRAALIREKALKKCSHSQIEQLLKSSKNILNMG